MSGALPSGRAGGPVGPETLKAAQPEALIPSAQRSADYRLGYEEGCAWYADYIQRIAAIRDRAYWENPQGDAGDAVDFACDHAKEPIFFLEDWRSGRADEWPEYMRWLKVQQDGAKASAIEAQRAETAQTGSVHESAAPKADAQPIDPEPSHQGTTND